MNRETFGKANRIFDKIYSLECVLKDLDERCDVKLNNYKLDKEDYDIFTPILKAKLERFKKEFEEL